MSGLHNLPGEKRHRRLQEARRIATAAANRQSKERRQARGLAVARQSRGAVHAVERGIGRSDDEATEGEFNVQRAVRIRVNL